MGGERQRLEKELELVQHNLRQHTELADEAHSEIERTCGGIKELEKEALLTLRLRSEDILRYLFFCFRLSS